MERIITAAIATAALAVFAAPSLMAEARHQEEPTPGLGKILVEHIEQTWLRRSQLSS
jgi:hypothetical protein